MRVKENQKRKIRLEREVHSGIVQLCTDVKDENSLFQHSLYDLSLPTNSDKINVK